MLLHLDIIAPPEEKQVSTPRDATSMARQTCSSIAPAAAKLLANIVIKQRSDPDESF